jgi:RNA polymerase sigma-70 factor (ECF subfamily)
MQKVLDLTGPFEARYLAFLETVSQIRPRLHRYCARMTGSVLDGEDIVQDALFEAYRKLDQFDGTRPLSPWLFRIAHNRCIDFLRHRHTGRAAELAVAAPEAMMPTEPAFLGIGKAVEHLVLTLPPKERACVLLKDVFDYTLEEIAELVESTVGGVKAALKRGRSKLAASPVPVKSSRTADPELAILDLRCKPIQFLVLVDIETWEQVYQVEDISDQRGVESRLWLVQFVGHVCDHVRQPHPQVHRSEQTPAYG